MAAAWALMSREVIRPATKLLMGRSASTVCSCWGEPTARSLLMVPRQRARTQGITVDEYTCKPTPAASKSSDC